MGQIKLFTFPDPADPPMAVIETMSTDLVHTDPNQVARYVHRYENVRDGALSEEHGLALIAEVADQIAHETGTDT